MKNVELEKTKRLARLTRLFCRITVWATAIGTALLAIAVLVAYLVPPEHIKPLQAGGQLKFIVGSEIIPAEVFASVDAMRKYLFELLNRITAGVIIYIIAAIHVMGLLKSVETGEPFSVGNVRRLRRLSLVLMIGSVIIPSITVIGKASATHINLIDMKSTSMIDLTLLLCGFLVLVLSGIFAYGARLQREHDQTV